MTSLKPTPWITEDAYIFLENFLTTFSSARILECGSGGSTLWFARKTPYLISLEHSYEWFSEVQRNLVSDKSYYPVCRLLRKTPYDSTLELFQNDFFDLILIDGHNRIACAQKASRILKKGGVLMLDDAQRPEYKKIFEEYVTWPLTKTVQQNNDLYNKELTAEKWTCWWIKP